jgi:hypothetical protein
MISSARSARLKIQIVMEDAAIGSDEPMAAFTLGIQGDTP